MRKVTNQDIIFELTKCQSAEVFLANDGRHYIYVRHHGKQKTTQLGSSQWASQLVRACKDSTGLLPEARRDEITAELRSMADETNKREVFVRVGRNANSVQIDLNDGSFNVAHVTDSVTGFRVRQPKGVFLHRPFKQQPMPVPLRCKRKVFLKKFQKLMPRFASGHELLVLAYALKVLDRDRGSVPILVIEGPHGVGKSILSSRLKRLLDPARPPFLSPPRNSDDIIVAAQNSYVLVYDNVSGISPSMADVFCRLSTGGGINKRKLYSDDDEVFYELHRPVIFNGIDEPSSRPDFVDRCIFLELMPLADSERAIETELAKEFEADLPYLLGGLFELLSECLAILPTVQERNLPRMTEYARMGIAMEKALRLKPGTFLDLYRGNRREQNDNAFWNDDLCSAIYETLQNAQGNKIEGTAYELVKKAVQSAFWAGKRSQDGPWAHWLAKESGALAQPERYLRRPFAPHSRKEEDLYLFEYPPFQGRNHNCRAASPCKSNEIAGSRRVANALAVNSSVTLVTVVTVVRLVRPGQLWETLAVI